MKNINLAEWAIRHRQIVYFFIISIIIGGIFSYFRLGRSEDPNFTIREMVIGAAWPGATAEQITEQVTYPWRGSSRTPRDWTTSSPSPTTEDRHLCGPEG